MRNFSPVSEMRKGRRRFVARNSRNKLSRYGETQSYKFRPIITLATLVAVSLMSNGMLMMWKIQQGKQDDAKFIRKINPAFLPVTGLKCSYGKISSPLSEIREPSLLALLTHGKFTKDLEVRRNLQKDALKRKLNVFPYKDQKQGPFSVTWF